MPSVFSAVAHGRSTVTLSAEELRKALVILVDPEDGVEIRCLPSSRYEVLKGDDLDGMVAAAERFSDEDGTFFTLNPITFPLSHRARKDDVLRRRWILVDVDRAKGENDKDLSATEAEKEATRAVATAIHEWLETQGWPAPVFIDSGNGWHLLYRIDMACDRFSQALLGRFLKTLASRFDSEAAQVDRAVHNPARISKLPGTWARKGTNTPDRPHRLARIVYSPPECLIVPLDVIQRTIGEPVAEPPVQPAIGYSTELSIFRARVPSEGAGRAAAYIRRVLQLESARVGMAPTGGRNNALNVAAFNLGTLIGGGELTRAEAESVLRQAAERAGLDKDPNCGPRGIEATIRSGIEAGIVEPRGVPDGGSKAKAEKREEAKAAIGDELLTICAADITPMQVVWTWPNRVPKRFITVFAGRTGLGKSFVTCDMVARITNGDEIPFSGGQCFKQGSALFISEDPPEYMLVPRLIEMGANLSRVRFMSWKAMMAYTLTDTDFLDRACKESSELEVVVIDPPTNFLGEADEHRNSEVRQTLMHLVTWVKDRDVALILIMHVNKQTGKGFEALNRVMGSVAWVSTSRIAHSFAPDPEDPSKCLFVPMKNNLGLIGCGLSYAIKPTATLAEVEWLAEVDITADEAMNKEKSKKRRVVASEFLEKLFVTVTELPSKTIYKEQEKTTLSADALKEAKEDMGIKARQMTDTDGVRYWIWYWTDGAKAAWMRKKGIESEGQTESF